MGTLAILCQTVSGGPIIPDLDLDLDINLVDHHVGPKIYYLHIKSDIRYRFATTLVTSKIVNPSNQAHQTTFEVTLPNEAFITNFTLTVRNQSYTGEVKTKEVARQEYDKAVSQGRTAAHIAVRPRETNMFNIDVNVAAEEKITFELRYQEMLQRKLSAYNHVIYVKPGEPVADLRVDVDIFESRAITDLKVPPITNDLLNNIDTSSTNDLAVIERLSDRNVHIRYQPSLEQQTPMGIDGQLRVSYDVERHSDGGDVLLVNGYFVHFFAPSGLEPRPKDIVFVLDKSGSMSGTKIRQLKEAMATILNEMNPEDNFNIISFDSRISRWLGEDLLPASEEYIQNAKQYVDRIRANGGTNIQAAMLEGISLLESRADRNRSAVIIFLTDGEPTSGETDPSRILSRVAQRNEDQVPVFSLAFGQNADFNLVKRMAVQNNGFGRRIYEDSDASLQISNFYSEVSTVVLKDVTYEYLSNDRPIRGILFCDVGEYYHSGSEVVIAGKMTGENVIDLQPRIRGVGANGLVDFVVPDSAITTNLDIIQDSDIIDITEKLWAYLTIKQWTRQMEASTDEQSQEEFKQNITEMALKYHFVTQFTSMVVTLPDELQVSPVEVVDDELALEEDTISHMLSPQPKSSSRGRVYGSQGVAPPPSRPTYNTPGRRLNSGSRRAKFSRRRRPRPQRIDTLSSMDIDSDLDTVFSYLRPQLPPIMPSLRLFTSTTGTIPQSTTTGTRHSITTTARQPSTMGAHHTTTTRVPQPTTTQPTSTGLPTTTGVFQPTTTRIVQQTATPSVSPSSTTTHSSPTVGSTQLTTRAPLSRKLLRSRIKASGYTLVSVNGVDKPLCFKNPGPPIVDTTTMYNLTRNPDTGESVSIGYTFSGSGRRRKSYISRILFRRSTNTTTELLPGVRIEGGVQHTAPNYLVLGEENNLRWEVFIKNNKFTLLADFTGNAHLNNWRSLSLVIPVRGTLKTKKTSKKAKLILKVLNGPHIQTEKTRVKYSKTMQCWITKRNILLKV